MMSFELRRHAEYMLLQTVTEPFLKRTPRERVTHSFIEDSAHVEVLNLGEHLQASLYRFPDHLENEKFCTLFPGILGDSSATRVRT